MNEKDKEILNHLTDIVFEIDPSNKRVKFNIII